MADAHETDYDSLEIRPRKPKLTYGRKGQRDRSQSQSHSVASARQILPSPGGQQQQGKGKGKGKAVRPRLNRANSAAELGKRTREKVARRESESSEDDKDDEQLHPSKRPRANLVVPPPLPSAASSSLNPAAQTVPPFTIADTSPKTKRKPSTHKTTSISRSRSASHSTRRGPSASKDGRQGRAAASSVEEDVDEGGDEVPRKKRKVKRVASREEKRDAAEEGKKVGSAAKMDVEAQEPSDSVQDTTTSHEVPPKRSEGQHQPQPQRQQQSPARHSSADPQLPPPTPRQLVLGDKSNLPRAQQNQRLLTIASPHQHSRSRSTTAAFAEGGGGGGSALGGSPRGVARHASTGGAARRSSTLGSPSTLRVYRDQPPPVAAHSITSTEVGAESTALNLRSLSSALPNSAPLFRAQTSSHSTSTAPPKASSALRQRPFSPRPPQASASASASALPQTSTDPSLAHPQLDYESTRLEVGALERPFGAIPPPLPSEGSLILPRTDGDHSSIVLETYDVGSEEEEDEIILATSMVVDGAGGEGVGEDDVGEGDVGLGGGGRKGAGQDEGGDLADDESDPIEEQEDETIKMHDDAPQLHDPTVSISAEVDAEPKESTVREETAVQAPRFTSPFQHYTSPSPQSARTRPKIATVSEAVSPPPSYSATAQRPPHQHAPRIPLPPPSSTSEILLPRVPAPRQPSPNPLPDHPSPFDPFTMPPRLPRLPLLQPRDTGPLSDEDDLEYFIATTGTHSSEDEEEWRKSEREVGEGVRGGGVRGSGSGRRRWILGLEEVQMVEEGADELGIGWEEERRGVEGELNEKVSAEGEGGG
ncbi:hypothetical protein BCR35DRAFT_340627 [Leucosporidium creatinivorum]|uniref:Uncharacterized protein n=1 Tax=Leucosporidium creatinivorum TaxID=106004 RepID=A0A1Y2G2Z0_9BASI|nr:hypothetical protein BCR35DRAFT_340627 [Leucosporidium creatinivorum]